MRKSFVALLLILGAAALANTAFASPDDEFGDNPVNGKLMNAYMAKELRSRAARIGPSTHNPGANDTIYVGFNPAYFGSNYWCVGVGELGPQGAAPPPADKDRGYWDFETPVNGDSLQGWWPVRYLYIQAVGTRNDKIRPWHAIDQGNSISYVINQDQGCNTSLRRTFGVTSAWHQDPGQGPVVEDGKLDVNPLMPRWLPLSGLGSAWCGLRSHGDVTRVDPLTGNGYNIDTFWAGSTNSTGATGTNRRLPGYLSQMDQMLYRDIDISGANPDSVVKVYFKLRTRMSSSKNTANATRTGWFDKDPLSIPAALDGNFISSSDAGADAVIDSFMVYVGCPVADTVGAEWLGSDGLSHEVFDPVRRWFGELIRANEASGHYEVYTTWGNRPPIASAADSNLSLDVCAMRNVTYGTLQSTWGNKVRLVFRVKTNRGFDDQDGSVAAYNSGRQGAAQLDSVSVDLGAGSVLIGDFENQSDINNDAGCPATAAWKTSSKPPAIAFHTHELSDLIYQDLCGPPGSVNRICNLYGTVISMGDHDLGEAINGPLNTAEQEHRQGIESPAINLASAGTGDINNMGLDLDMATPTEDFYIFYESYTGCFSIFDQGSGWQFVARSYPATQSDGTRMWGEARLPPFQYFNPDKQCFGNLDAFRAWGMIRTSNAGLQPDSIRIGMLKLAQCYRFNITTDCGSTDGAYWDNMALAIVDQGVGAESSGAPITVNIWDFFNDTFPQNEDAGLLAGAGTAFDTCAALVKPALNSAPSPGNLNRYCIPEDSTVVTVSGLNVEVQLNFRILPGPGNYHLAPDGSLSDSLKRVPTDNAVIEASDSTFWTSYILNNGKQEGEHNKGLGGHPTNWNPLVWNSARCDTAEQNIFPIAARNLNNQLLTNLFASIYHEDEFLGKRAIICIPKPKCFLDDTAGVINENNITCSTVPIWADTTLGGVPNSRTGYDGNQNTLEYTKIIPDGILTPGSHVEYFYVRKNLDSPFEVNLCPDTAIVFPQNSESSFDAHRWQEFSVLPDAWKFTNYGIGHNSGLGAACMLYVDWNDRRGNERIWVSIADSIGATATAKNGAHNGWSAPGGADINNPLYFVNGNQQPGTTWDMYGIKASESLNTSSASLGERYGYEGTPSNFDGEFGKHAPTIEMLERYYHVMLILTGDLNSQMFGPFTDKSQDDQGIITSWLLSAASDEHRGIMIEGDGFVESLDGDPWLNTFGVALRNPSYLILGGNLNLCPDLLTTAPITGTADIYGMRSTCLFTLDVLDLVGTGQVGSYYSPVGANPINAPYISGVFQDIDPGPPNYWQSLVDGWNVFNLRERFCVTNRGRNFYYLRVLSTVFSKICALTGSGGSVTETPQNPEGKTFVDFATIGNNPLRTGEASINLTLAKTDRVEVKIYDVSGRLIRTLADGQLFRAGPQKLTWDGLDNGGRQVARGVYFTHIKFANSRFENSTKMVVLK